jgi:hypothetical protein
MSRRMTGQVQYYLLESGERGWTSLVKQEFLEDLKILRTMPLCSNLKYFKKGT